jgi:pimeloyl-ACP methyl ester carboxylesterase
MPDVATSLQERPVFFSFGDDTLFGIVTEPMSEPRGVGVILLYGGGYTMTSYYNQYWTRMSRRLSGLGYHAMRFDHHGNGDSTGRVDEFDHKAPFTADFQAAIRCLETFGVGRFLLVGDCLGGRAALEAAVNEESVEGVFLISAMVRDGRMDRADDWARKYGVGHYLKRAFRWKNLRRLADRDLRRAYLKVATSKARQLAGGAPGAAKEPKPAEATGDGGASPRFLQPLEAVLARGARVGLVYGDADEERWGQFQQAMSARLGEIITSAGRRAEVMKVSGSIADIPDVWAQDEVIEAVAGWVSAP